jgi:hypothetical protein
MFVSWADLNASESIQRRVMRDQDVAAKPASIAVKKTGSRKSWGASKTTALAKALPKSLSLERVTPRLSIARDASRDTARLASDHFRAAPRRATARTIGHGPLWITTEVVAKMRPPASRNSSRVTP